MLLYLVLDLSLLRGLSREANLAKLVASITRTLLLCSPDDLSIGYTLYDSHVGGYMLSYQLNMVAQGMGIPKNVATTSACDLTRDDLVNLLTLVKLVTDKNVVEELNLRTSRNSRSSDIPAVETCKVLHTVLKTTCVHKLQESPAGNSSSHSEGSQERSQYGYLLIMTPSLGSMDVLHGYVGKDALETCGGDLHRAFLKHLPLSLWKMVDSHKLSCAWMSGNGVGDSSLLERIQREVKGVFPRFALTSLDVVSAKDADKEAFVACTGFQRLIDAMLVGEEAESRKANGGKGEVVDVDSLWAETSPHSSIELLQMSMAKLIPRQMNITPLGHKSRRKGVSITINNKSGNAKRSALPKVARGVSKKLTGAMQSKRGQRAIRRARMPDHPKGAAAVAGVAAAKNDHETPTSTVDQNTNGNLNDAVSNGDLIPHVEDLSPCTLEEAGARIAAAVVRIEAQVLEKTAIAPSSLVQGASKDASIAIASEAVHLLTSIIQRSMADTAKYAADRGEVFDATECRAAFIKAACTPVEDLQCMHRTTAHEKLQVLAWSCTVQLLLRLCIAITSCSWKRGEKDEQIFLSSNDALSPQEFGAVEDIMHVIVATMSPIPSGGHTLFLKVVKPCFVGKIKDDIMNLEKSIWDEEEMATDGDGGLVDVRMAAESLEESGETPDESMDNSECAADRAPERNKISVSKTLQAVMGTKVNGDLSTQTDLAGVVRPTPALSADGSGVHGSGICHGTAASTRRGELSNSNLLSRRFNNSKQYKMVVRANPGKSKLAAMAKPTQVSKAKGPSKSGQTSEPDISHLRPPKSGHQVPDTPLGKAAGEGAVSQHNQGFVQGAAHSGLATPDTAIMKKSEDVIPNTSPREQPAANTGQMKRIGSIRQPLFDDASADAVFKATSAPNGSTKNTWLSRAIVKRRNPVPSGATRMGDLQNVDSITLARQETETDLHKEIMSPLKPRADAKRTEVEKIIRTVDAADAQILSMRTRNEEEVDDDIEVVLSPGPLMTNAKTSQDGKSTHQGDMDGYPDTIECNHGEDSIRQLGHHGKDDANRRHNDDGNDDENVSCSDRPSTFVGAMSDDEDSMAAKNDGEASECSSSHLHGCNDEEGTSTGGDDQDGPNMDVSTKKSPFDCTTPTKPLVEVDEKVRSGTEERTPPSSGHDNAHRRRRNARGGRLARMHAGRTANLFDHETTPASQTNQQRSRTPTRSPITVEDRGSPCKPSPGHSSFSSPPRESELRGPIDYSSDTDSCVGDTPDVMVAMKPLIQASPDKYDSEEEDAAILNAAATGGLSPVDNDKPAPTLRRVRIRSLAAVTTRGPGEIARRNKARTLAAIPTMVSPAEASDGCPEETPHAQESKQTQNQNRLTAPLGQKKRAKPQVVHEALDDSVRAEAKPTCQKKVGKMTRMPEQGDIVVCFIKSMDAFVRSTIAKEGDVALARRGKGWCLTAEVVPVEPDARHGAIAGPFTVKLDSTKEISPEDSIKMETSWYRVDPSSPGGPTIVQWAGGATEPHNKAVKAKAKKHMPRQESIPVLRPIDNLAPGAVSNPRKRRKLEPTNLRYEGKALASAEKIQLQRNPRQGLLVARVEPKQSLDIMGANEPSSENDVPEPAPVARALSLNDEAKSVIARAKALLNDPMYS